MSNSDVLRLATGLGASNAASLDLQGSIVLAVGSAFLAGDGTTLTSGDGARFVDIIESGVVLNTPQPAGIYVHGSQLFYDLLTDKMLVKRGTSEIEPFTTVTVVAGTGVTTIGTIDNVGDYKGAAISVKLAGMTAGDFIVLSFATTGTIFYVVLTSHLLAEDGTYTFRISPALENTHGLVANDHVPRQMSIEGLYLFAGDVTVDCIVNWFN